MYLKENKLRKLKYLGTILLDTLLAGVCKAANPGVSFISLGALWLNPKSGNRENHYVSFSGTAKMAMHIAVDFIFELLK